MQMGRFYIGSSWKGPSTCLCSGPPLDIDVMYVVWRGVMWCVNSTCDVCAHGRVHVRSGDAPQGCPRVHILLGPRPWQLWPQIRRRPQCSLVRLWTRPAGPACLLNQLIRELPWWPWLRALCWRAICLYRGVPQWLPHHGPGGVRRAARCVHMCGVLVVVFLIILIVFSLLFWFCRFSFVEFCCVYFTIFMVYFKCVGLLLDFT